jgi:hypothetical protein
MQKIEQPTQPPSISDPLHITEIFASGPINLMGGKDFSILTFTSIRADTERSFAGGQNIKQTGVVVARIALPNEVLHSLHSLLNQSFGGGQTPGRSSLK